MPTIDQISPRAIRAALGAAASFCVLAIMLLGAASAEAKPPRSFYGVVPQTQLGEEDFARMGQGKVGTLRTPLVWAVTDPSPVPEDGQWAAFDTLVENAARNGIQVLPTITSTPSWVSQIDGCTSDCYNSPPRSDLALVAWRQFLREAVRRYGPDGLYWTLNPSVPKMPIRVWQIWNEMNSPSYFSPEPNVGDYAKLVTEASRAIEGEDAGAEILLGGMFATPLGGKPPAISSWIYLRQLLRRDGFNARFDGVALHPYAQSMKGVKPQIELVLKEMQRFGAADKDLWITEIGWASGGPKGIPQVVGAKGQATKLRQSFKYFTKKRKKFNIRNVDWFSWRDAPPGFELCTWCPESGLFGRSPFQAKPAWRQFVRFTGGS